MIVAALRYKDRLYYQELENGQSVSFGSGKKDTIQVLDMEKEQIPIKESLYLPVLTSVLTLLPAPH